MYTYTYIYIYINGKLRLDHARAHANQETSLYFLYGPYPRLHRSVAQSHLYLSRFVCVFGTGQGLQCLGHDARAHANQETSLYYFDGPYPRLHRSAKPSQLQLSRFYFYFHLIAYNSRYKR